MYEEPVQACLSFNSIQPVSAQVKDKHISLHDANIKVTQFHFNREIVKKKDTHLVYP